MSALGSCSISGMQHASSVSQCNDWKRDNTQLCVGHLETVPFVSLFKGLSSQYDGKRGEKTGKRKGKGGTQRMSEETVPCRLETVTVCDVQNVGQAFIAY